MMAQALHRLSCLIGPLRATTPLEGKMVHSFVLSSLITIVTKGPEGFIHTEKAYRSPELGQPTGDNV